MKMVSRKKMLLNTFTEKYSHLKIRKDLLIRGMCPKWGLFILICKRFLKITLTAFLNIVGILAQFKFDIQKYIHYALLLFRLSTCSW